MSVEKHIEHKEKLKKFVEYIADNNCAWCSPLAKELLSEIKKDEA